MEKLSDQLKHVTITRHICRAEYRPSFLVGHRHSQLSVIEIWLYFIFHMARFPLFFQADYILFFQAEY